MQSKISSGKNSIKGVYAKYERIGKRHIIWNLFDRDNYESYEDFKKHWNPNNKLWEEIKRRTKVNFKNEVEEILGVNKKASEIQSGINGQIEDLMWEIERKRQIKRSHTVNNQDNFNHNNQHNHRHSRRSSPLRNHKQHGSNNIGIGTRRTK